MPQVGYGDGVYVVKLHNTATLGHNVAATTMQDQFIVPFASRLMKVQYIGDGVVGTTSPTCDIYKNTASTMSAATSIAADNTVYEGTLATGTSSNVVKPGGVAVAADDILSLRCVTHAADGHLAHATAILTLKSVTPWVGNRFFVQKISAPATTLGNNVALTTEQGFDIIPGECELILAKFVSDNITANATMAAYINGTIKTNDVTIAADDTVYTATMVPPVPAGLNNAKRHGCKCKTGDIASLRCYTDGTGDNVTPSATLVYLY